MKPQKTWEKEAAIVQTENTPCPSCNGNLTITQLQEDIPYFGPISIITTKCRACEFKHNDIIILKAQHPSKYWIDVTDQQDLLARIIRSSSATTAIPELKVEITPGPFAEAFVSNVEGVLERIENVTKSMTTLSNSSKQRLKVESFLERLEHARNGRLPFRFIIKDPMGNSAIVSPKEGKVNKRRLSNREIAVLKIYPV